MASSELHTTAAVRWYDICIIPPPFGCSGYGVCLRLSLPFYLVTLQEPGGAGHSAAIEAEYLDSNIWIIWQNS